MTSQGRSPRSGSSQDCERQGPATKTSKTTPYTVDAAVPSYPDSPPADRKSTRLNSSHLVISYAVFCLKKTNLSDVKILLISHCPRILSFRVPGMVPCFVACHVIDRDGSTFAQRTVRQTHRAPGMS